MTESTKQHLPSSAGSSQIYTPEKILDSEHGGSSGTNTPPMVEEGEEAFPRKIHGAKWVLVVVAILSTLFLYALDNTIVANVQPAVVATFGNVDLIPWMGVSFALASAATTLPWSKLYGIMNAKYLYLVGVVLFMGGSALCGAAPDIESFIVGRAIAGAGGAGMYLGILTLLSVTTTNQERPKYLSLTGLIWGIGTVLGPVVGAAFAESPATWRWGFYINLVVGAVFGPVYVILLPSFDPQPDTPLGRKWAQVDWLGSTLSAGAMACVVLGINMGGVEWAWGAAPSIVLFVLAFALTVAFGVSQSYAICTTMTNRLFPMHFWKNRTLVLLFFTMMLATFGSFIGIFYLPLYFQFAKSDTAIQTSVRLLPFILFLIAFNLANGQLMARTGYYYPWYIVGAVLELVGGVLMYTVDLDTPISHIYGYTIILGTGVGCFCQAGFAVAQMKVLPTEIPDAVGFMTVGQMLGIVFGVGMAGAIFVNTAEAGLAEVFPEAEHEQIANAIAGVGSELIKGASESVRRLAIEAIVNAISKAYIPIIAAGAICIVCSLLMKREKIFIPMAAAG